MATHSDQALALLSDPTENENAILSQMKYQRNDTWLHTDTQVLPKRPLAWAAWNYHLPHDIDAQAHATVSYNMNILQGLKTRETFCVTLNDTETVPEDHVRRKMIYHHPVYSLDSVAAQDRFDDLDQPRTHYCGAYWGWGFHEDGVRSALRVCSRFGEELS